LVAVLLVEVIALLLDEVHQLCIAAIVHHVVDTKVPDCFVDGAGYELIERVVGGSMPAVSEPTKVGFLGEFDAPDGIHIHHDDVFDVWSFVFLEIPNADGE
jgi:hypothetical protein